MIKASVSCGSVSVLPDTRTKFERLNRMSLYYLLKSNGIECHDSMPKTKLVQMCEIDEEKLVVFREDGQYGYKNVEAYRDPVNGQIHIRRPVEKEVEAPKAKPGRPAKEPEDTIPEPDKK